MNMQCVHQTVDLHYAIAKGTRVYPIENSIEVRDIIIYISHAKIHQDVVSCEAKEKFQAYVTTI